MLLQNTPRTSRYLTPVIVSMVTGVITFIYLRFQDAQSIPVDSFYYQLGFVNILLFALYVFWYSSLNIRQEKQLKVGEKLPSFTIFHGDKKFNSLDFKNKGRVFLFYRGNWCPFCVAQIKELVEHYQAAINSGIEFIMISPQSDKKSQALAKKFNVPFIFATDRDNQAAKQLGIFHEFGLPMGMQVLGYQSDTPLPTVIRIDQSGTITFIDQTDNYRIRPDPKNYAN